MAEELDEYARVDLRVLSLGAGVQSTMLALAGKEFGIKFDCAIFSDVGAEPKAVYDHLDWLETQVDYPVYRITHKDGLTNDIMNAVTANDKGEKYRVASPPFYTRNEEGKKGMVRRVCTSEFKILPIYRKIRELLGLKKHAHVGKYLRVLQYMGISYDELQRQTISPHKWMKNLYPLVESKITRQGCFDWMKKNGYPEPPRSACTYCPYHRDSEWHRIKTQDPQSWTEAVELDRAIRNGYKGDGMQMFVHRSATPLEDVNFDSITENNQQTFGFDEECSGMCGL